MRETKRTFYRGICGWLVQYGGVDDAVKMVQSGVLASRGACANPLAMRRYCNRLIPWQESAEYRYKIYQGAEQTRIRKAERLMLAGRTIHWNPSKVIVELWGSETFTFIPIYERFRGSSSKLE